jgi:urea transport system ATP-binding protein
MLEAKTIDLHYGAAQALRAVSLTAEPGKVTCVLGRNGVGKTSLLDALAGQQPISRGSISFDGRDITSLKPSDRARRGIAYVPQGREIFPRSRSRKISRPGSHRSRRGPQHPDDVPRPSGAQHARFMRRRPLVGSSSSSPSVVRCDAAARAATGREPTEGIQPSIIKDIGRAIAYLRNLGQIATVLVEQYLDFALELEDYFAVMDRGAIVYSCTRETMDEGALRRAMAI